MVHCHGERRDVYHDPVYDNFGLMHSVIDEKVRILIGEFLFLCLCLENLDVHRHYGYWNLFICFMTKVTSNWAIAFINWVGNNGL